MLHPGTASPGSHPAHGCWDSPSRPLRSRSADAEHGWEEPSVLARRLEETARATRTGLNPRTCRKQDRGEPRVLPRRTAALCSGDLTSGSQGRGTARGHWHFGRSSGRGEPDPTHPQPSLLAQHCAAPGSKGRGRDAPGSSALHQRIQPSPPLRCLQMPVG